MLILTISERIEEWNKEKHNASEESKRKDKNKKNDKDNDYINCIKKERKKKES